MYWCHFQVPITDKCLSQTRLLISNSDANSIYHYHRLSDIHGVTKRSNNIIVDLSIVVSYHGGVPVLANNSTKNDLVNTTKSIGN